MIAPTARIARLALVLGALAIIACSGTRNRRQALQDAVTSYSTAIRWGHVQKAAQYVPEKDKADFIARKRRAYQRMTVMEVDLRAVHLSPDQERARVLLAMRFTVAGNPVIQQHVIEQVWRHGRMGWEVIKTRRVIGKKPAPAKPGDLY